MSTKELYAADAAEHLRRWDAGEPVWTIDMGGLGPGYEQAIQILAVEIVRDGIGGQLPDDASYREWGEEAIRRNSKSCGGFTGAQVGAAKNLAWNILKHGPAETLEQVGADRRILVSKSWPRAAGTSS